MTLWDKEEMWGTASIHDSVSFYVRQEDAHSNQNRISTEPSNLHVRKNAYPAHKWNGSNHQIPAATYQEIIEKAKRTTYFFQHSGDLGVLAVTGTGSFTIDDEWSFFHEARHDYLITFHNLFDLFKENCTFKDPSLTSSTLLIISCDLDAWFITRKTQQI